MRVLVAAFGDVATCRYFPPDAHGAHRPTHTLAAMNTLLAAVLLSALGATAPSGPLWSGAEYAIYPQPGGERAFLAPATANGMTVAGCITAAGENADYLVVQGYSEYFLSGSNAADIPYFYLVQLSDKGKAVPHDRRRLTGPLSRFEYDTLARDLDLPALAPVLSVERCRESAAGQPAGKG